MFAAGDALEALNPLVISLRILGLCPYILDKTKKNFIIYQRFRLLRAIKVFLILAIAIAGSQDGLHGHFTNALELALHYGINYGNLTFILLTFFLMNKDFKRIIFVTKQAMIIDAELDGLSPLKMDHKTTRKSCITFIIVSYVIILIFFSSQFLIIATETSYTSVLKNLAYLVGNVISASLESLLFTMLRELRRRYTNINGILLFMQKENLEVVDAFERLGKIKRIYGSLRNLRTIVGAFNFQILIKYYMSYTSFLASLFFLLSGGKNEWQTSIGLICWSGMSIMELIGFTFYYDRAYKETKKSAIYYENTVQMYDPDYLKRGYFYSLSKLETNMFSVCGLFVINWNFLLVMLGSILSNLAVLIQFNAIAERNK